MGGYDPLDLDSDLQALIFNPSLMSYGYDPKKGTDSVIPIRTVGRVLISLP